MLYIWHICSLNQIYFNGVVIPMEPLSGLRLKIEFSIWDWIGQRTPASSFRSLRFEGGSPTVNKGHPQIKFPR